MPTYASLRADYGDHTHTLSGGLKLVVAESLDDAPDVLLVRYLANGNLDTSFGQGGAISVDWGGADRVQASLKLSNGKVLIAGSASAGFASTPVLMRLNADGTPDATFGTNGVQQLDGTFFVNGMALAVQSDGRILLAYSNETGGVVQRFSANGLLDTSYGAGGTAALPADADALFAVSTLALQSDGRLLVAGSRTNPADLTGNNAFDWAVVRLSTAGAVDTAYGTSGVALVDMGATDLLEDIVLQSDGKLVLQGNSGSDIAVARLTTAGRLDTTFDTDGKAYILARDPYTQSLMTVNAAGAVTLLPGVDTDVGVRFSAAGVPDLAFGPALEALRGLSFALQAVLPTGQYSAATTVQGPSDVDLKLAVYTPAGAVQRSATVNLGGDEFPTALAVQGSNLLVGGTSTALDGSSSGYVARFNPTTGALDAAFGSAGSVLLAPAAGGANSTVSVDALAVSADSRIWAAGAEGATPTLWRLSANGQLDTSFSGDGKTALPGGAGTGVRKIIPLPDGRVLLLGDVFTNADGDLWLARLNANGTVDATFGTGGTGRVQANLGASDTALDAVVMADGRIVVAAYSAGDLAVVRFTANGERDTTFDLDGVNAVYGGSLTPADTVTIGAGGTVLVRFGTDLTPITFNPDGSVTGLVTGGGIAVGAADTFTGNAGSDNLSGTAADETFYGLAGNDTLTGNGGNDTLEGGAGKDTAVYAGNRSGYSLSFDEGTRTITLTDANPARSGTDTLVGIETLQFADGNLDTFPAAESAEFLVLKLHGLYGLPMPTGAAWTSEVTRAESLGAKAYATALGEQFSALSDAALVSKAFTGLGIVTSKLQGELAGQIPTVLGEIVQLIIRDYAAFGDRHFWLMTLADLYSNLEADPIYGKAANAYLAAVQDAYLNNEVMPQLTGLPGG